MAAPNLRALPGGKSEPLSSAGRVPPHDLDAEAAVLSAMMNDPTLIAKVADVLPPDDFYSGANGGIAEALYELHREGRPIDLVILAGWFRDREKLAQIGGPSYLAQLCDATPSVAPAHVMAYVETVKLKAAVRRTIATCQTIAAEGYGDVGPIVEWLEAAPAALELAARVQKTAQVGSLRDAFTDAVRTIEEMEQKVGTIAGVPTGLASFDELSTGTYRTDFTLLGAPRGGGKSAFGGNVAAYIAETPELRRIPRPGAPPDAVGDAGWMQAIQPLGALIFSQEMRRQMYAIRMACSREGLDYMRFRRKIATQDERQRLMKAIEEMANLPIFIDDEPGLTIERMVSRTLAVRADMAALGIRLTYVLLDYLQLLKLIQTKSQTRENVMNEAGRALKELAVRSDTSLWAITALNQGGGARESEALEYHADAFYVIERDEDPVAPAEPHPARIIGKKQRIGGPGVCATYFHPRITRFSDSPRIA